MRNTHRLLALALCFSLTLGAFVYRPPQAEAVAAVDDAVVIGALLAAFAGGCGLTFSNNGMTSSEIASGLSAKWNEYKATLTDTVTSFAGWLGYDDTSLLLQALVLSGGNKLTIPRAVGKKLAEFTTWLKADEDVAAGGSSTVVEVGVDYFVSQFSTSIWNLKDDSIGLKQRYMIDVYDPYKFPYKVAVKNAYGLNDAYPDEGTFLIMSSKPLDFLFVDHDMIHETYGSLEKGVYLFCSETTHWSALFFPFPRNFIDSRHFASGSNNAGVYRLGDYNVATLSDGAFEFTSSLGVAIPDLSGTDETPVTVTTTGVDVSTIEDLLQQILAQTQANTLTTTITVAGQQTGGDTDTDTDEDAKSRICPISRRYSRK